MRQEKNKKTNRSLFRARHTGRVVSRKIIFLVVSFFVFFGVLVFFIAKKEEYGMVSEYGPVSKLEVNAMSALANYPMRNMIPYLSQKDKTVAALLIAIAKKESDWGKFSPRKDGRDCYNYWGYRGDYNQTDSGYSCFDTPWQAVSEVGGRLEDLMKQKIDTPRALVTVWKCGYDCSGQSPKDVNGWVNDVDYYYKKLGK